MLEKHTGHGSLSFDVSNGAQYDLTNESVQRQIYQWVRSRRILGIHVAFPCATWSNARRPALRTKSAIRGFLVMLQDERSKALLEAGNATLDCTVRLAQLCLRTGVVMIAENPATSLAWFEPQMQALANLDAAQCCVFDQCKYGAPHRKPPNC